MKHVSFCVLVLLIATLSSSCGGGGGSAPKSLAPAHTSASGGPAPQSQDVSQDFSFAYTGLYYYDGHGGVDVPYDTSSASKFPDVTLSSVTQGDGSVIVTVTAKKMFPPDVPDVSQVDYFGVIAFDPTKYRAIEVQEWSQTLQWIDGGNQLVIKWNHRDIFPDWGSEEVSFAVPKEGLDADTEYVRAYFAEEPTEPDYRLYQNEQSYWRAKDGIDLGGGFVVFPFKPATSAASDQYPPWPDAPTGWQEHYSAEKIVQTWPNGTTTVWLDVKVTDLAPGAAFWMYVRFDPEKYRYATCSDGDFFGGFSLIGMTFVPPGDNNRNLVSYSRALLANQEPGAPDYTVARSGQLARFVFQLK